MIGFSVFMTVMNWSIRASCPKTSLMTFANAWVRMSMRSRDWPIICSLANITPSCWATWKEKFLKRSWTSMRAPAILLFFSTSSLNLASMSPSTMIVLVLPFALAISFLSFFRFSLLFSLAIGRLPGWIHCLAVLDIFDLLAEPDDRLLLYFFQDILDDFLWNNFLETVGDTDRLLRSTSVLHQKGVIEIRVDSLPDSQPLLGCGE